MRQAFSERDRKALVSFVVQCERLILKNIVDGWSITRKADSATVEMRVGGALLTGQGPTLTEALIAIGETLVDRFSDGASVDPSPLTRIPFSGRDNIALTAFIQHSENLFDREYADGWSSVRGPDNATVTLYVGALTLTGAGATLADASKDLGRVLSQTFPSVSAPPSC